MSVPDSGAANRASFVPWAPIKGRKHHREPESFWGQKGQAGGENHWKEGRIEGGFGQWVGQRKYEKLAGNFAKRFLG